MADTTIRSILARPIFDGCARPSLEVEVQTGSATVCAAPSYSDPRSSGKYEIIHFPEGGVAGSIKLINSMIRDRLVGMDSQNHEEIDNLLLQIDGTDNFARIGGNTAEATSMAVVKAAAASLQSPLYRHMALTETIGVPHQMPNIIGGGATMGDEGWKGRTPDIQDHIILPIGCRSILEEMQFVSKVFHRTGAMLRDIDPSFSGGRDEEYCWIPRVNDVTALTVLRSACEEVASEHDCTFRLGLDVGAADLWNEAEQVYVYTLEGIRRTPSEHARHLADLTEQFDLFYLEDSFYEDHVELYIEQVQQFGDKVLIAGDDLLAGSLHRLEELGARGALNAAVIKLNMCGTVSRTSRFVQTCHANSFATIGSCRTYDSADDTLADLVVGWGCNTYKCGSPAGGEHAAKHNRYLRIDEQLGKASTFNEFPELQPAN